jgi:hypothetical protein
MQLRGRDDVLWPIRLSVIGNRNVACRTKAALATAWVFADRNRVEHRAALVGESLEAELNLVLTE